MQSQVPNEMGAQYNEVLSAQDVAVYGGLCALASFDRHELRTYIINNVSFRDYMEVNPEVGHTVKTCSRQLSAVQTSVTTKLNLASGCAHRLIVCLTM